MNDVYPIKSDVICLESVLKKHYVIPPYQRPYEWNENNLDVFLQSIINGFEKHKQVFFGTMQVAENRETPETFDIVDGQQRITTFMLLINVFQEIIKEEYLFLDLIEKNPIKSVFGDEKDAGWLNDYNTKKYVDNKELIEKKIRDYIKENEKDDIDLIKQLRMFIMENVYVVFLVTMKDLALSEIVSVFNTINTTGLDLNASDVFKFRYYDYLCKYYPDEKKWMNKINEAYLFLERSNDINTDYDRIEMSWVLDVYKHVICATFDFNYSDMSKSNMSFFEDLFNEDNYKDKKQHPILRYESFFSIVKSFVEFHRWIENTIREDSYVSNPMELFSYHMLGRTRYSKYWTIPYVATYFMLKDEVCPDDNLKHAVYQKSMMINLSFFKLFLVYSVIYAKAINQVHNRVCKYLRDLKTKDCIDICKDIESLMWVRWIEDYKEDIRPIEKRWEEKEFYKNMTEDLYDNGLRVRLVCTLSALIDEIDAGIPSYRIFQKLFSWDDNNKYDIEHIWARNLYLNDEGLADEEKRQLNGIGNLVILERGINRDIKDASFDEKKKDYENSDYISVKRLLTSNKETSWDIHSVSERQCHEIDKIKAFMG